jgi:hypothetical protein
VRTALTDERVDDPGTQDLPVLELEVIDLSDPGRTRWCGPPDPVAEWRSFEERYATLAFGLGVVPRRRVPDDPLWARPAGILLGLGALLAFLLLLSTA